MQRLGDYLRVLDNGLQNLAERFAVPEAAQAHNVLSSINWERLFEEMFQQASFLLWLGQECFSLKLLIGRLNDCHVSCCSPDIP